VMLARRRSTFPSSETSNKEEFKGLDTNGEKMNSNMYMLMEITSFMMREIWPSYINHLFLNQLHAIEYHERLNALLKNHVFLLKGMKTRLGSEGLS